MEDVKAFVEGCLADARIAMGNGKYKEAKAILLPAYEKDPHNAQVLQKLGGACTLLGEFEEALTYYQQNLALNPEDGNNHYMLGNAYFVNSKYQKAFAEYVEAENKGCTGEAEQKLHYQMGLICSLTGDRKAALLHLQQYEDTDPTGKIALEESYLTEKLKLYMQEEDNENAIKYARILLEAKPTQLRYYGVLFSLLMADKQYEEAEAVLDRADRYLDLDYEQTLDMLVQRVAMYADIADAKPDESMTYLEKALDAIDLAEDQIGQPKIEHIREMMLLRAEIYLKENDYDTALEIAEELVKGPATQPVPEVGSIEEHQEQVKNEFLTNPPQIAQDESSQKYIQQLEDMALRDPGIAADVLMNPEAVAQRLTEESETQTENTADVVRKMLETMAAEAETSYHLIAPQSFADRLNHILITCYIEADRFEEVLPYAVAMKGSTTVRYANFGCYVEALAMQKLAQAGKKDKAEAENVYQRAIAFYRKKMMDDPSDISAAVFRARLYAENGKYALAEQVAGMLDDAAMQSLQAYIEECRQANDAR